MYADTDKLLGLRRPTKKWRDILLRDPCVYCGRRSADMTLDHVVPRSSGAGKKHRVKNSAPACFDCNQRKSDMSLLHFLAEGARQRGWAPGPHRPDIMLTACVRRSAHFAFGTVPQDAWWQTVADFVTSSTVVSGSTWLTIPLTSVDGVALRIRLKVHVCVGADGRPARVKFLRIRGPEIEANVDISSPRTQR